MNQVHITHSSTQSTSGSFPTLELSLTSYMVVTIELFWEIARYIITSINVIIKKELCDSVFGYISPYAESASPTSLIYFLTVLSADSTWYSHEYANTQTSYNWPDVNWSLLIKC